MNTRSKRTTSYDKQMQEIARRYREHIGSDEMNIDKMFNWAKKNNLYSPPPLSVRKQFRKEMSRALGRETKTDPQGRIVKANHAYRVRNSDGQWEWDWAPIETIKPNHFRVSLTLRRNAMVATAIQHHTDWSSYNDNNVHGAQLPEPDYNFDRDVLENLQSEEYPEDAPDDNEGND